MARLIDADALMKDIKGRKTSKYPKGELEWTIEQQPTIEAVPVVQAKWIYENYTWHCGACGFHPFKGYIPKEPGFNFCPNCMADMRKGGA